MKRHNTIRKQFEKEMKDRIINILLELLKKNNVPIPEPVIESLEKIYGVKDSGNKTSH